MSCRPMPCLQLIVRYLKDVSKPLPTHIKNMWRQAMLGDPKVGWFFQRSGGVLPDSDEGKAVAGEWARVCPGGANMYFVANLNHFGALGGFDAALERIRCSEPSAPLPEVALITNLLYIGRFLYTVCMCRRACDCGCGCVAVAVWLWLWLWLCGCGCVAVAVAVWLWLTCDVCACHFCFFPGVER